jgi:hypothetical protein
MFQCKLYYKNKVELREEQKIQTSESHRSSSLINRFNTTFYKLLIVTKLVDSLD